MIKTHIYINEHLHQQVTHLAEERGVSMAEIIREFIREGLQKQKDIDYTGEERYAESARNKSEGWPERFIYQSRPLPFFSRSMTQKSTD